ncbi:Asialoglycoprotein receptor 1 [Myotis davidii]|uniref:Asialoglycoprotein receptor 1 n=1 Tax=Myotis davidii TaxID=225400 RepID=L5MG80_MYODS|nr:Asialoglycoprotein receptor 1 [Myotis davidii]
MKYEDLQSLESEKKSQGSRKGLPPPPAFLQHLCSGPWPLLLSLGLILLLMIGICVIGSKTRSLNEKVFSLESELEKEQQELKADYSEMLLQVQQLLNDLTSLHCQMAVLKNNGSQNTCCPIGWLEYEGSCYWFSRSPLTWPEAEKHCQLKNSHLVVLSSWNEQKFLEQHMYRMDIWIGLTEQHGPWTWVNGKYYNSGFQNWSPTQPDNWYYHGQEDCAHFGTDDQRKNYLCMIPFHWICETELSRPSA